MDSEKLSQHMLQGMRAMRIANQNCFLPACKRFDLTFQQFTVIMELAHSEELTSGELSDHVCILRTNFASVTNKLGQRGLICQSKSTKDRRYNVIRLTEKGETLAEEIVQWLGDRYGTLFDGEPEQIFYDMIRGFQAMEYFSLKLERMNQELEANEK